MNWNNFCLKKISLRLFQGADWSPSRWVGWMTKCLGLMLLNDSTNYWRSEQVGGVDKFFKIFIMYLNLNPLPLKDMHTPSREPSSFAQKAIISLVPLLSACSIQIGGFRTAEPEINASERYFEPLNISSATRDELIRCILNAPENNKQFEHSTETRLGGTYEKGSFTYYDEKNRSTKVDVSVTQYNRGASHDLQKKVTVWGVDGDEQALKACQNAY